MEHIIIGNRPPDDNIPIVGDRSLGKYIFQFESGTWPFKGRVVGKIRCQHGNTFRCNFWNVGWENCRNIWKELQIAFGLVPIFDTIG